MNTSFSLKKKKRRVELDEEIAAERGGEKKRKLLPLSFPTMLDSVRPHDVH